MRDSLLDRFVRYTAIDTTSDASSASVPSTDRQFVLLDLLCHELRTMGCTEVERDEWGYVTATIESSDLSQNEKVIGLLAHVDTSPDMVGAGVRALVHPNYDPSSPLPLGDSGYSLCAEEFSELSALAGHTLITSDGTTLLGADDKAGVAEIMTAAQYLLDNPQIRHGKIRIAFTPDEEIGRGVDHFDVAKFGADFAYTIDGGAQGCFEYENFNAAKAIITITGCNTHPGYAKEKMVNALGVACHIDAMIPFHQRPENTEDRDGFFHLHSMSGTVERAVMEYIIRDHDRALFENKKALLQRIVASQPACKVEIEDQYYNMGEVLSDHPEVIARALTAIREMGIEPRVTAIRGGTDGARLSYMGLPCPNLFTGAGNIHSRYEYCSLDTMEVVVRLLVKICEE